MMMLSGDWSLNEKRFKQFIILNHTNRNVIPSLPRNLAWFIRAAYWRERDSSASSE